MSACGLLAADVAGVAEQLLELVEQQADVAVRAQAEALPDARERVPAAVQQAPDGARGLEARLGVALQLLVQARDRGREVPQGRAARAHARRCARARRSASAPAPGAAARRP